MASRLNSLRRSPFLSEIGGIPGPSRHALSSRPSKAPSKVEGVSRAAPSCQSRFFSASPPSAHPTSIHPSEIEHFSRLSASWWDEHGEFGLLHAMNPTRMQFIREKLIEVEGWEQSSESPSRSKFSSIWEKGNLAADRALFLEGLDVLDVGCGGGLLSESLARSGARTTGIDAAPANIGIANLHASLDPSLHQSESLQYRHITAEQLLEEDKRYDIVCAMEVVEHVNGPAEFLKCLGQLVKPGGHIFLSTIARTPLAYFLTILMAEKVLRLVTPGTHTFEQYIKPDELVGFFRDEMGWIRDDSEQLHQQNGRVIVPPLPARLQYEVRGTAFLPWKNAWGLAPRESALASLCNYFFWVRKPLERA